MGESSDYSFVKVFWLLVVKKFLKRSGWSMGRKLWLFCFCCYGFWWGIGILIG